MPERIILDCDPGVDDAVCIMLATASPGEIAIEAITTVGGNLPLSRTSHNAIRVCELIGSKAPIFAGAAEPLGARRHEEGNVHGTDGLGDIGLPPPRRALFSEHAVDVLIRIVSAQPREITLCVIGPMTNVATALQREPGLAKRIKRLLFMGGTVDHPGNSTPMAEFNIWFDAAAAAVVAESGIPMTMFGLDVTAKAVLTPDRLERLERMGHVPEIAARMLRSYAIGDACLHDPCVAAYLIDPSLFSGRRGRLRIECTEGADFGRTIFTDDTGGNCHLITDVDTYGLFRLIESRLAKIETGLS